MAISGSSGSLSRWRLSDRGQLVERRCADEILVSTLLEAEPGDQGHPRGHSDEGSPL